MKNIIKNIPDGMRDMIYGETNVIKTIGSRLTSIYKSRAYGEVITPSTEFYDVFDFDSGIIPQEYMFKLTDKSGKLIVLRPDNTTPIARIVSTRLKSAPLPIKLCYNQNVFRVLSDYSGKRSEIYQTGIEIIGGDMVKTDIESVSIALKSLREISDYFGGNVNFKLEIGHVGYYKAIVASLGLSDEESELVQKYVEAKNSTSPELFENSENSETRKHALSVIQKIPRLFGGVEVFAKARELAKGNEKAIAVLEYLNHIFTILSKSGYAKNITIDLSAAHKIEYYTGFLFRAYLEHAGEPILSGGRYDMLLDKFGLPAPATGFGINLSLISDAANKICPALKKEKSPSCLIHYKAEYLSEAEKYIDASADICELSCFEKLSDSIAYAAKKGIPKIISITSHGTPEIISQV